MSVCSFWNRAPRGGGGEAGWVVWHICGLGRSVLLARFRVTFSVQGERVELLFVCHKSFMYYGIDVLMTFRLEQLLACQQECKIIVASEHACIHELCVYFIQAVIILMMSDSDLKLRTRFRLKPATLQAIHMHALCVPH